MTTRVDIFIGPRTSRLLVALVLTMLVLVAAVDPASGQVPGLAVTEDTIFTVSNSGVEVESTFTITNTTVDRREGDTIFYQFFEDFIVPVPLGASDLNLESNGASIATSFRPMPDDDPDFQFVVATLPSRLRSGDTRVVTMTYELPKGELRGENLFVSNPAFHGFPLWSSSDPGTGSIQLRVPESNSVAAFGEELDLVETVDGTKVYEPRAFEEPQLWYTYVTVQNPAARDETSLSVAGQDIILLSWPDDAVWVDFATRTITEGLPALERVIGSPIPDQSTLEINESVDPYLKGFAGWYTLDDTRIEVGNELDDAVMLHELSHAWFNGELFDERWIGEGLAEEFTWQAQDLLVSDTKPLPTEPDIDEESAQPLLSWNDRQATIESAQEFEETDRWAYNASWWVIRELVGVVGDEAIQEVIVAGINDEISYVGDAEPETLAIDRDWRQFLDLAVERSDDPDAVDAELDELFREYVLTSEEAVQLDERAQVRDGYESFTAGELGWRVPAAIRESLTRWDFVAAQRQIDEATEVQERYIEVFDAAADVGLTVSDAASDFYQASTPDLPAALDILDQQEAAIDSVLVVRRIVEEEQSVAVRWGLGEGELDRYATEAETAFNEDRFGAIDVARQGAERARSEAARDGRSRLIVLAGLIAALLVVVFLIVRNRRAPKPLALNAGDPVVQHVTGERPAPETRPTGAEGRTRHTSGPSLVSTVDLVPEVSPPKVERITPPSVVPPAVPADNKSTVEED